MAPSKAIDDDPVTAEYDVFITPPQAEQIILLQYPNRTRSRPYNARIGSQPQSMRIKPLSEHFEIDVNLNTNWNFNRYQALKWGDALTTAKDLHNSSATFGSAAGFHAAKPKGVTARTALKDHGDREEEIGEDLDSFERAEERGKVLQKQVLGGQIMQQDQSDDEGGRPSYYIGAFRDNALHFTNVDGAIQMRPQFHHIDAEDQRARVAASRAALTEGDGATAQANPRGLLQRAKTENEAEKDRLEDKTKKMLQMAEAEEWNKMNYVDEEDEEAFALFHDRMFVEDATAVSKLKSSLDHDQFLDLISTPRRESPNRTRKRSLRKRKDMANGDGDGDEDEEGNAEIGDGAAET